MLFKKELVEKILKGEKTQTRRLNGKYKVGNIYAVCTRWYSPAVAWIKITGKRTERLGDISLEDVKKEGFNSLEEFKAFWIKIHGHWDDDLIVYVYDFELVSKPQKEV